MGFGGWVKCIGASNATPWEFSRNVGNIDIFGKKNVGKVKCGKNEGKTRKWEKSSLCVGKSLFFSGHTDRGW